MITPGTNSKEESRLSLDPINTYTIITLVIVLITL